MASAGGSSGDEATIDPRPVLQLRHDSPGLACHTAIAFATVAIPIVIVTPLLDAWRNHLRARRTL